MGPAPAAPAFRLRDIGRRHDAGSAADPGRRRHASGSHGRDRGDRTLADHDGPLCRRYHGPSSCPDIDAVSCPPSPAPRRGHRRTWPVLTMPRRRSLSVRRPEPSPHRRSCILLAAARLLSLRTRHTAPCYIPLNEHSTDPYRDEPLAYIAFLMASAATATPIFSAIPSVH